jgi:outer membrane protein, heavy metal efflux system
MLRSIPLLLLSLVPLRAQHSPSPVTLDQAIKEALEKNLGLMAERYNVSIAEARIIQARLRPNPVFSLGLDYQDVFHRGFTIENSAGPPEANVRTDFVFERGGKREWRTQVAEQARGVAQLNLMNTMRQLIFDVQSAFIDVLAAKASLALAETNLKALNSIVEVNTSRVRAGDLAEVELMRSRLAALQFQNAVRQAQLRLQNARNRLQLLLGRRGPSDTLDVSGDLRTERVALATDELLAVSMKRRPDLQALQRDQARSQADIRLQLANAKVDYSFGVQYHHQYSYSNGRAMGFFFSAPLPIWNRNQGEVERARREQAQIETRIRASEAGIATDVQNAYQQYATARSLLDNIEKNMLEQARQVRDVTEYSYRRGEASLIEFLDAQRAFNDTMQSYNDARADYARALFQIESVTGQTVNP